MSRVREPLPCTLVIFGATGDLASRKLLPAIYNLAWEGLLHPDTSVVGFARRDWGDEGFRRDMREGVEEHSRRKPVDEAVWSQLAAIWATCAGSSRTRRPGRARGGAARDRPGRDHPGCHLFYLSTPPSTYHTIVENLGKAGLVRDPEAEGRSRIVVEKPFGRDLDTARELNRHLRRSSTRARSSASTTTWARRRSRTY